MDNDNNNNNNNNNNKQIHFKRVTLDSVMAHRDIKIIQM